MVKLVGEGRELPRYLIYSITVQCSFLGARIAVVERLKVPIIR